MDWIFDHLQILIAAGAGVAYWLNQRNEAKETEQSNRDEELTSDDYDASEDEARARKIREDIRRKIAERSGGSRPVISNEPMEAPPPLFERPFQETPPVADPYAFERRRDEPRVTVGPSAAEKAVLERQRVLQERMKELEKQRSQSKPLVSAFDQKRAPRVAKQGKRSLRDDLSETGSLRRAIVLREVLGPPVSMR